MRLIKIPLTLFLLVFSFTEVMMDAGKNLPVTRTLMILGLLAYAIAVSKGMIPGFIIGHIIFLAVLIFVLVGEFVERDGPREFHFKKD